jgi:probable addiction module antidote protein
MVTFTDFNVLDYLGNEEAIAGYLQDALEEEDPEGFLDAASDAMRARAILMLSKDTGIEYKVLCQMFAEGNNNATAISRDVLMKATKVFAAPISV